MKIKYIILLLLIIVSVPLYGQDVQHPWSVIDGGGGASVGSGFVLDASIGQPAVQKMTYIDTGMVLESGFIPGLRNLSGTLSTTMPMEAAWNLISIPLQTSDMRKTVMFPTASSSAFNYEPGGYVDADTLGMGLGYWLKYTSPDTEMISGTRLSIDTIPVYVGWNMIGALTYPMLTTSVIPLSPVTISSSFFAYSPSKGYYNADTLKPCQGYWIKVTHAGSVVLDNTIPLFNRAVTNIVPEQSSGLTTKQLLDPVSGFSNLVVQDGEGSARMVFYSESPKSVNLDKCQLPPIPPDGSFDVRFASQRFVEVPKEGITEKEIKYPIKISGTAFPYTINWDNNSSEERYSLLRIYYVNKEIKEISLVGKGSFTIKEEDEYVRSEIIVCDAASTVLPKEYALHDNYPNPFNPTTVIRYDLPFDSRVTLKVFDILGRVVATIVDKVQDAGYKSIEWNAADERGNNLSTGVYFYQLAAGDYKAVKKMLLLR